MFKVGDYYKLKLQHKTLIEDYTDGIGATGGWNGDTFDCMEIVNGVLKLHFKWEVSGAGTLIQYIVRYQSNDFYLIGATCTSGYHASQTTSDFNFSTGRYAYDMTDDEIGFGRKYYEEHKKGKLPTSALKKFTEIKGPEYWSPGDFIPGWH
ncbi:hypothetical protein HDF18_16915 [Mucilaginibacter sp. X5P1]|uniref:hypothetical protein n=1 Tax=Mucilaginibacter sp. X5P1 TaxID=2723088 RepID=UPI0016124D7A|nr:hypothetical protein [Mucilaginibacter sp. X5P1]MBB6139318.1 hypothetical protein [Mucilaginibacter sp. X5P1]